MPSRVFSFVILLAIAAPSPAQDSYSAATVAAYKGKHEDVYRYIDKNLDAHVANLQRWVRQRSISAQNDGIRDMAEMLRKDLLNAGFKEAELVPTTGHPGLFGFYDAGAKKTLVVYMMYDVQPVEPQAWRVAPFDGAVVDHELGKVLMARGATNQKGPERAFLNAVGSDAGRRARRVHRKVVRPIHGSERDARGTARAKGRSRAEGRHQVSAAGAHSERGRACGVMMA